MIYRRIILTIGLGALLLTALLNFNHYESANASAFPRDSKSGLALSPAITTTLFLPTLHNNYLTPLWRFGVDRQLRSFTDYNPNDVQSLRLGWYFDFGTNLGPKPFGLDYMPEVWVKQLKDDGSGNPTTCRIGPYYLDPPQYTTSPTLSEIHTLAANNPGRIWIVGNEMERIDWGTSSWCAYQSEMVPELYAVAYHDVYWTIKAADPTAQVAIGPMVQFSPLRQQYLDRVWAKYQELYGQPMPVDVWAIHVYVFQEKSCAAYPGDCWGADIPAGIAATSGSVYAITDSKDFSKAIPMITALRTWMQQHGQQDKPLITNEYGAIMPDYISPGDFTPSQISASFMYPSFNYFLNQTDTAIGMPSDGYRLMQRWAWWSLDFDSGYYEGGVWYEYNTGYLFNSGLNPTGSPRPVGLSELGTYWQLYVASLAPSSAGPYLSSQTMSTAHGIVVAPSLSNSWLDVKPCPDDPKIRAQILAPATGSQRELNDRITAISKLTGGTKVCLSSK